MEEITAHHIASKERERHLESSVSVGQSPAFVIEIDPENENGFTLDEYKQAIDIRNQLAGSVEEYGCFTQIHREANSIHVPGVILTQSGYNSFEKVVRELKESGVKAKIAMSVPQAGDEQFITRDREILRSTMYGSSVLGLARGAKKSVDQIETTTDIPVYQLPLNGGNLGNVIVADKGTKISKTEFDPDSHRWLTTEELKIKGLQSHYFDRIEVDFTETVNIDTYLVIKADIIKSGKKITMFDVERDGREAVDDRRIVVSANFDLLSSVASHIELDGKSFATNILGDSVFLFIHKDGVIGDLKTVDIYTGLMRDFAERESVPDLFISQIQVEKATREKQLGHLSSVEIPIAGDNLVLFKKGNTVVGFGNLWDADEESRREKEHKDKNMKPSEIHKG